MHLLDLKGVIAIAGGSLIWHLVRTRASLGAIYPHRIDEINRQMKDFQEGTTEHRMPPFRQQDLHTQGWACLGSKLIKAANTRALVPFLKNLADKYFPAHGAYAKAVRKVFNALNEIERFFMVTACF